MPVGVIDFTTDCLVERVHEERVIAGQAGNRRPTPVFTSYMISTFYH